MFNNLFVVSAPSGAGKTSLTKALCESDDKLSLSVSHTTRKIRHNETDGIDYFFVSVEEFNSMLDEFIEHACVYNNHYGTHKDTIQSLFRQGMDVVLEIDWQGARQIKNKYPNVVSIFIVPPSLSILKSRIQNRATDSSDIIESRLNAALDDLSHANEFEYIVVNDDFTKAKNDLIHIVHASRLRSTTNVLNF